jgi:hypothetical protein
LVQAGRCCCLFVSEACKLLVDDPEFSTLPMSTRELVLRKLDPAFASLNRYERYLLLYEIALKNGAQQQGGLTLDGIPVELALPDRIRETINAVRAKLPEMDFYLDELARIARGFEGTRQSVPLGEYLEAMYLLAKHSSFSRLAPAVPSTTIM